MDRGESGRHLPAPNSGPAQDPVPAGHQPLDPERLSLTTPAVAASAGRVQSQRPYLGKWRAKESVLCAAEILSRVGSANTIKGLLTMKSYRKELWFNVPGRRAFINITPQVEECVRESGA